MATYQPPTENLPKFNEFVFNQANSPEYLDQLVVHKAGNETITGAKVFTGDFGINNAITVINSSVSVLITSASVFLNSVQNRIASNLSLASTSIGNQIDCQGGYNYITSATTSVIANLIEATGGGSNAMSATGAGGNGLRAFGSGNNTLIASTGSNQLTSSGNTATANLLDAIATGGGNTIRTTTGTNSITSTTGQVNITTGALTNTGINIENTSSTTGGITLKTNGTTGDIILTSGDNINLTASGTAGDVLITSSSSSTGGITLSNLGTGGISIVSSTTSPLTMGTGSTNYATVSSAGVGATQYWVGTGGSASFPLIYPVYWFSTQTTGQTTSQMRIGSFANNDTAETFLRYRIPYKSTVSSILLLSDDETINANQTYIHISITNTTGLDTTPNYAYWIYNAGVANPGNIVVSDSGSMTNVADIPANTTFYVYMAFGSSGTTINSVGTPRTVPTEFQVHLYLQQVV